MIEKTKKPSTISQRLLQNCDLSQSFFELARAKLGQNESVDFHPFVNGIDDSFFHSLPFAAAAAAACCYSSSSSSFEENQVNGRVDENQLGFPSRGMNWRSV